MKSEKKQSKKDIATREDVPGDDSKKKARPSQKPKQPSSTSNEEHPAVARVQRSATPFHNIPFACPGILPFVKDRKFESMTPVQAATIPQIIHHRKDVVVQAVTGSGKTLAFLLPLVELIFARQDKLKGHQIGGLVLSPTRELALQTYRVALDLCKACEMPEPLLLVGGGSASSGSHKNTTNIRPVTQDLQRFQELKSDILIGTCGRVEDVLTRYSVIDTSELECLILDEADVLLNMGFAQSLQAIMGRLPKHRRTGLFSATTQNTMLSEWMKRAGVRNPVYIDVSVSSSREDSTDRQKGGSGTITPSTLTNYYIVTTLEEKLSRLVAFLQDHSKEKIIVFFLTCACVQFYGQALQEYGIDVELLHGKLVQKRREKAMERFREGTNGAILFCTDVAARGLDVSDVNWVVQFDAPQDPAFFVHRVGRSARAGRSGSSLLFLTRKEEPYIELLLNRKVPLQKLPASERCCPPETELEDQRKSEIKSPGIKQILCARDSHESIENVLPIVRGLVMKDRDLLEKGTKAYTSYIRAYKEHHCAFIFRFASLDLGALATSFCLLRLPKMPELRDLLQKHKGKIPHFDPAGSDVDIFAIPFRDKVREKARQTRIQQEIATGGKNAKQLKAEQRKLEKLDKKEKIREYNKERGRNPEKKRGKNARIQDDWDELAKEERLFKKLRKGKISQEEYDEQVDEL